MSVRLFCYRFAMLITILALALKEQLLVWQDAN